MTSFPFDPDVVWVPVPRALVRDVMRFIGTDPIQTVQRQEGPQRRQLAPEDPAEEAVAPADAPAPETRWTDEDLADLVAHAYPKQLLVLQYLAQRSPDLVTAAE